MENDEVMNVPEEEKASFDGLSSDETGVNVAGSGDVGESENDKKEGWYDDPDARASESPKVKKLLDDLTDDGNDASDDGDASDAGDDGNNGDAALKGAETAENTMLSESQPTGTGNVFSSRPKTAEEEEMELLQHVKSERGRERIKSIIAARKEAELQRSEARTEIDSFKNLIGMTGLDGRELAQTMEYGRLVNKGDEQSLQRALNMLEEQRDAICKKLGREAPGVDLLSDFPDLKSAVERQELSMNHALKLARYERAERLQSSSQAKNPPADEASIWQSESLIGNLDGISAACNNYFRQYEKEADHPAKMERIYHYFSNPDNMNVFLRTVPPPMWFNHVKFLYENMPLPPRKNDLPRQQPLRSRSMATGSVADNPNMSNFDRIMKRLDDMGI